MLQVRGISEDERGLMHSLSTNILSGGKEHMRLRHIYAHGIATMMNNRSAAHLKCEAGPHAWCTPTPCALH